jgi:peptidoglycan/LPS O-acetylase OafA/YrhL
MIQANLALAESDAGETSRVPDSYLPALTGLRGIAACWVLLFHVWQFSGSPTLAISILDITPIARFGYMGVDLFFVLSGFLLSLPFLRADMQNRPMPRLSRFWIRRCRRVLPAYYVQLVIIVAALWWLGQSAVITPLSIASHALLIQNLFAGIAPLNAVYWTMPIEWDFYIVLPLMALMLMRLRPPLACGVFIGLSIAYRMACYRAFLDPTWARFVDYGTIMQLPARLDEFFFGILGAWLFLHHPISARTAHSWIIAGTAGIVIAITGISFHGDVLLHPQLPWTVMYFTWIGLSFGAIVRGAAGQSGRGIWFGGRVLGWLGLISYSLYLWHYPLLKVAQHFHWNATGSALAMLQNIALLVPAILAVSWLSQHFVERPFLVERSSRPATHGMPASIDDR